MLSLPQNTFPYSAYPFKIDRHTIELEITQPLKVLHGVFKKLRRDTPLLKLIRESRIEPKRKVRILTGVIDHFYQRQVEKGAIVTHDVGVGLNFFSQNTFAHVRKIEKRPITMTLKRGQHSIKMNISNPRPHSPKKEVIVLDIVTYESDPAIKYLLDDSERISFSQAFQMSRRQRNKVGFAYFHGKRDTQQVCDPRIFAIGFNVNRAKLRSAYQGFKLLQRLAVDNGVIGYRTINIVRQVALEWSRSRQ
jgi:hypothetical protein